MATSRKATNIAPESIYPSHVWQGGNVSVSLRGSYVQDPIETGISTSSSHTRTRVATTADITLSGTQTIDGVTLADGDRILVKEQSTATENGIYSYLSTGAYTREDDTIQAGMLVSVLEGTANGNKVFTCASDSDPVIGTDSITFALVGGIDGSGTTNTLPKFSDADTLTDSDITDNGTTITLGDEVSITSAPTGAAKTMAVSGDATQSDDVLYVTTTGTGRTAHIRRDSATATEPVALVHQDNATNNENALHVTNDGTGTAATGVWVTTSGGIGVFAESSTRASGYIYRNNAGTATEATAIIWQDNASDTLPVLSVRGDGTGDLLNVTQGGTERFVVEDAGQVEIKPTGTGTALRIDATDTTGTNGDLHVTKSNSWGICYFDVASNTATHGFQYLFRRGRGNITAPTSVSNGDQIGGFLFRAHNGSAYQQRAGILAYIDEAVSGTTVPTTLIFYTGTTGLDEKMRITSGGDVGIGTGATISARLDVECSNATIGLRVEQNSTGDVALFKDASKTLMTIQSGGAIQYGTGHQYTARTVTASTTITTADHFILVDTNGAAGNVTLTLPANPDPGEHYVVIDSTNNAGTNNIILGRNGNLINGGAANLTLSTNGDRAQLFSDGTNWFSY